MDHLVDESAVPSRSAFARKEERKPRFCLKETAFRNMVMVEKKNSIPDPV